MATNLEILIQTCVELGSAKIIETLGLSFGEISQRKARALITNGLWMQPGQS